MNKKKKPQTLGELIKSGYTPKSIKTEMRDNLISALQNGTNPFEGIHGYEETVLPQLQTAILSEHNIILLGLRGQAKTRIARLLINLLDEEIPYISGSEIYDDPIKPISTFAQNTIAELGNKTPISWLNRAERYAEKLATPDVSVADLIGDVDPIKAANMKLHFNDERVIHYGIIPRSNRCLFVLNELPDLQARIQVALFNILQEGDLQIRGFKFRLPLDVQFIFTANPEDYTNRGSIVTPLKDRIDSQILTHYPKTIELAKKVTSQEARISESQRKNILVPEILLDLIEHIAMEARNSDWVDQKSGVSARLTISALENLYSTAERRMLLNKDAKTQARISDIFGVLPSITGKVELVYEGELEGAKNVAQNLIGKAIRTLFLEKFSDPEKAKRSKQANPYATILNWFNDGYTVSTLSMSRDEHYLNTLLTVEGLGELVKAKYPDESQSDKLILMELLLHGLAECSQLSRTDITRGYEFSDLMSGVFKGMKDSE
ncbi:MAG: magnesium chelatase [Bacteroidia bacterium]|nr:magnesium chelatase [Bacteroidia bacterium]